MKCCDSCHSILTLCRCYAFLFKIYICIKRRYRNVLFSVRIANEPKSIDIIMWHALRIFFPAFFLTFPLFHPIKSPFSMLYSGLVAGWLVERSVELAHFSIYSDWWCDMVPCMRYNSHCSIFALFLLSIPFCCYLCHSVTECSASASAAGFQFKQRQKIRWNTAQALWKYNLSLVTHKFFFSTVFFAAAAAVVVVGRILCWLCSVWAFVFVFALMFCDVRAANRWYPEMGERKKASRKKKNWFVYYSG